MRQLQILEAWVGWHCRPGPLPAGKSGGYSNDVAAGTYSRALQDPEQLYSDLVRAGGPDEARAT